MPVALPLQKWPFSRDVNMREDLIANFLHSGGVVAGRGNPAAMPSTLMDFGFWDMPQAKPTPVGQALVDGNIFWSECVLWLLSKRPSSRENNNIKPLVVVCKFLTKCREIGIPPELWKADISPLSEIEAYDDITEAFIRNVVANRSVSSSLHGYADIWINAFAQTALFKFDGQSSNKHLVVVEVNNDPWRIVKYLALVGPEMSPTPPKSNSSASKKAFYEYMGSADTGIVEIIAPSFMRNLIPNLSSRYAHLGFAEGKTLKKKFSLWLIATGRSRASTSYPPSLEAMSAPQVPPSQPKHTKYSWPGMIEFLTGAPPTKPVFEIDNIKDFLEIYQPLNLLAECSNRNTNPGFTNQSAFEECWDYARSSAEWGDRNTLMSAFKAYCEFLNWLERICRSQEKKPKELSPANVDRLSIALKLFEEGRGTADHEMSYDESTARIRALGQIIDGDYLVGCDYASFRKTLHDKQVANSYFARHTDEDKRKLGEFMAAARNDPKDISHYLNRENRPEVSGVGDMLLTAFLTRVRPDLYAFYSNPLFVVVKLLGMTKDDALPQMTLGSYNTYKDIQTIIRDRMREMGIKAENGNDADYLTVNEFTWFVYANLDLVKDAMSPELRVPENVDRLSIALKQFANKRKEDGKDGWLEAGRAVNGRIREYFDPLTEEAIGAFGEEQIEELFCGKKSADGKVELVTMWSGKNGQGWSHIKKGLDDGKRPEIVGYLVSLKHDLEIASRFCLPDFDWHYGFGRSVISELLMKFHPENCIKHGERSYSALSWLRLIDFPWARKYSSEEYSQVCGAAAKILAKMKAMDMPRQINADGTGDDSPPDYLTVNEFLYFVDTNLDKIKEEVMSKQLKPVNSKEKIKKGTRTLEDAFKDDEMLKRLAAALRTKPFAILAGHSGTGKSRLVRRLAYMTCNNELLVAEGAGKAAPGNYCMVQVKPNWHDSTDLLGYYSEMDGRHFVNTPFVQFICKAYAYPDTPFFVCLDEMNLAPVEQYFAEYLSAVESMEKKGDVWVTDLLVEIDKTGEKDAEGREKIDADILGQIMKGAASTEAAEWIQKHGLTIPKNLFVVGTVNVDETTSQFPRKVLDRAMTLLMNEVRFADMAKSKSPSEEELLDETGLKFFLERDDRKVGERESKLLDGINAPLSNTPFMVAYRFGNEYALYEAALAKLDGVDLASADEPKQDEIARRALDHVVMMKLLPRIHGEKVEVKNIFSGYDRKKEGGAAEHVDGLKNKLPSDGLSVAMMDKILARDDEYLTFWP